jgi:hypothetical protein
LRCFVGHLEGDALVETKVIDLDAGTAWELTLQYFQERKDKVEIERAWGQETIKFARYFGFWHGSIQGTIRFSPIRAGKIPRSQVSLDLMGWAYAGRYLLYLLVGFLLCLTVVLAVPVIFLLVGSFFYQIVLYIRDEKKLLRDYYEYLELGSDSRPTPDEVRPSSVVKIRCLKCQALNDEDSEYCVSCGAAIR